MKPPNPWGSIASLLVIVMVTLFSTGCANRTLEPGGVYQGDKVLYEAEKTVGTAGESLKAFTAWEYRHQVALRQWPDVKKLADRIRAEGDRWLSDAKLAVDAYKVLPDPGRRETMQEKVALLRSVLDQVTAYYNKNPNLQRP